MEKQEKEQKMCCKRQMHKNKEAHIPVVAELPDALGEKAVRGDGVIYVCRGTHCEPPVAGPDELGAGH